MKSTTNYNPAAGLLESVSRRDQEDANDLKSSAPMHPEFPIVRVSSYLGWQVSKSYSYLRNTHSSKF